MANCLSVVQLLGEEERIQGYEGLLVTICLSAKQLIPCVKISYTKKAPPFAKIDDIEQLLRKHFGTLYTDAEKYEAEVLAPERASADKPGQPYEEDEKVEVRRVYLSDETFLPQNYFLQALLPFFIDGAVVIETNPFWNYFLVFEKATGSLMAYFTVYEAHLSSSRVRTKVSQVLVLAPFRRQGIASKVYALVYKEYREKDGRCFELMVEDSADDF